MKERGKSRISELHVAMYRQERQIMLHPCLVLPGNRDAASVELAVERIITRVEVYAFHCAELLNVQHVLAIHGAGL